MCLELYSAPSSILTTEGFWHQEDVKSAHTHLLGPLSSLFCAVPFLPSPFFFPFFLIHFILIHSSKKCLESRRLSWLCETWKEHVGKVEKKTHQKLVIQCFIPSTSLHWIKIFHNSFNYFLVCTKYWPKPVRWGRVWWVQFFLLLWLGNSVGICLCKFM